MPPRERRLQKARQTPKSVQFDELCRIYEDHGFTVRQGKGSHFRAKLPGTAIVRTFVRRNPVREVYVKEALKAIEEARALGFIEGDWTSG